MSRRSIADCRWPDDPWRVDLHSPGFEAPDAAVKEDAKRARMLCKRAKNLTGKRRSRMLGLADLLDPKVTPETPQKLASARYMREQRIRITGAVWQLVAEDPTGKVARFDVIKPSWAFDRKALKKQDGRRLREEFRADLNRAAKKVKPGGAAECTGFLFAVLHGEHETQAELFQIHWHLVATGDWVAVVDRLKGMKAYKPTDRVKRPIRKRKKLHDLAYALTYLLKSYWPGKWCGKVSGQASKRRRRKHGRIPEPQHSDVLMWLDRWDLEDLCLLMKVSVGKEGLVVKTVHE